MPARLRTPLISPTGPVAERSMRARRSSSAERPVKLETGLRIWRFTCGRTMYVCEGPLSSPALLRSPSKAGSEPVAAPGERPGVRPDDEPEARAGVKAED